MLQLSESYPTLAKLHSDSVARAVMKSLRPSSVLSSRWSGVSHSLLPRKARGDHRMFKVT